MPSPEVAAAISMERFGSGSPARTTAPNIEIGLDLPVTGSTTSVASSRQRGLSALTHSDHDHHAHSGCCPPKAAPSVADAVIRDPVCGMTVDPAAGKPTAEHGGHRYRKDWRRFRHRRHAQQERFADHARREDRRRNYAGADRRARRQGAAFARADPGPGRPRLLLFRPGRRGGCDRCVHRLGDLRAATQSDLCNRLGGLGADHRLSLRAGPCHADVDHDRQQGASRMPAC